MIRVENLSVRAGSFRLEDVSFEIPTGEYGVLMGRTGCGKTTVLEAICGLKQVTGGRIVLAGHDVTHLTAGERGIGFVPQDGTLFSTMTVRQHLAFGPKVRRWKRGRIAERVEELARDLGIEHLLDRKPFGLSGGERQRVSLGRALSVKPEILCLDEPLSALDEDTHDDMISLIRRVVKEAGITALHITHSRREAATVGDRLFFMENGVVGEQALSREEESPLE
ncbi:MAG: ATP-binding cassette domain-containing protein [Verrucomicrobiae bacterium]|nr:ATP-binding cassette domain-containing protein [Verrucomicrobiae bacterium]MCP5540706.1 ATP-binding cassette domain-containing protein [Akkermansiaceae bacterium]